MGLLSDGMVQLIMQTFKEGQVSSKTQDVWFTSLSFYATVNNLKRMGLMREKSFNGDEKLWELTEDGRVIGEHYSMIEEVLKKCRQ
jgi:hypothetical protein